MTSPILAALLFSAAAGASSGDKQAVVMTTDEGVVIRLLAAPLPGPGGEAGEAGDAGEAPAPAPAGPLSGLAVVVAPGVDPAATLEALAAAGGQPVAVSLRRGGGAVLYLSTPTHQSAALAHAARSRPEVRATAPWSVPVPLNDDSIWVGQSNDPLTRATPVFDHGVTGTGEVVAVWDTGADPDLCFFTLAPGEWPPAQALLPPDTGIIDATKKIWAYYVSPGATAYDPPGGHGTAVAGCVLGDDHATLSTPATPGHDAADGMAPNARLIMLDGGAGGSLSGILGDLTPTFLQAYRAGARIQNHSWGNPGLNLYAPAAADLDRFMWRHEDMLFVNAAGNSGAAPDDGSIIDPAVAKSPLAIGATVNGSIEARNLTTFTSRGPTWDRRLKPDLVAPGAQQHTAGSSGAAGDDGCDTVRYSGTSFASPTAAGFAALARQYLRDGFLPGGARNPADAQLPSAALVKAMLIASAVPLEGLDPQSSLPVDPPPSFNQGWGKPVLDRALFFAGDPVTTTALDLYNGSGLRQGGSGGLDLKLPAAGPELRVVLAWTDPPAEIDAARALINDLDLEVTGPDGSLYRGNAWSGGQSVAGGAADNANSVEAVRVPLPVAGDWQLRVVARQPLGAPGLTGSERQGFALVATHGACAGAAPAAPAGLGARELPAGIDLTWTSVAGATGYLVYRAEVGAPAPAEFRLLTPLPVVVPAYLDADVQCGTTYTYGVRAWDGCMLGARSTPASAQRSSGGCTLAPAFEGLADARPEGTCGRIRLDWAAAGSRCPCSSGIVYNVWASPASPIDPTTAVPVRTCVSGTSLDLDLAPGSGLTYFLVRAEDRVPGGAGPCGGVVDDNLRTLAAAPLSPGRIVAFADGFDTGRAAWQLVDGSGGGNAWDIVLEPLASSPPRALQAYDIASTSDSWAELLVPIRPTADTFLAFRHTYDLEARYDGGVVELTTDGGNRWRDAGARLITSRYDDWVTTGAGNRIVRPAFTGGTRGAMAEALLWLGDLAGQEVRFRFRMLSDGGGRRESCREIDDVRLFNRDCPAGPGPLAAFVHSGPVCDGDAVGFSGALSTGPPPLAFSWDFGDLSPLASGVSASHLYAGPGTYTVTLTVTDGAALSDSVAMPVTVVAETPAPDLGNVLRAVRAGTTLVMSWSEPPFPWPGADVMAAAARDLSDLIPLAWVPWDRPRQWMRTGGVSEGPPLRLFRVRVASTCRGLPGAS